jgi:integrase/recombinase XerD
MSRQTKVSNSIEDCVNSYIGEISLNKSELTVMCYSGDVRAFVEYLNERGIRRLGSVKSSHIVEYLGGKKREGKSDATVNRTYMSIRSFFRYLRKSKVISEDATQDVPVPKIHLNPPRIPNKEDVEKILMQPNVETESGLRDRAMLELLYSSGLRASELCDLELQDCQGHSVMVKCGKRSKTRTVPITSSAHYWIGEYLQKHRGKEPGHLFLTLGWYPIRRQLLCSIVMGYAKKAGVSEVTTHTMRHACATHLLDEGADLRLIQEVLGHSSIASTQRYTHLSSKKVEEMFNKFHPRKDNGATL